MARCRPLPTRPSHYVAGILAPLSAYLEDPAASALQPEPRQQIAEGVVLATTARYQSMAAEMLDTVWSHPVSGRHGGTSRFSDSRQRTQRVSS